MPATTHAARTRPGVPTACAITADFRKMPVPMVIPTTSEVACSSVRSRRGCVSKESMRSKRTITALTKGPGLRGRGHVGTCSHTEIIELHHKAHEECFIANSVTTDIRCEPLYET